jgi:lantibiotic modifying enzyme
VTPNDSLCDGRSGALELLRMASVQLSRPSLADRAFALAHAISGNCDSAASGLGWQHGYSHPGLMEGRAGIAYSLLRASVPSLPSVLVWL